ncbi:MAG: hypothetical protein WDW38_010527 [Sanguina aurantia]
MSSADVLKQLKIKTNSVKRLNKELGMYEDEKEKETMKVARLKAEGADSSDIKQAENVLSESMMMVPETRQRLEAAYNDLQSFVTENGEDVSTSEELTVAQQVLELAKHLFVAA